MLGFLFLFSWYRNYLWFSLVLFLVFWRTEISFFHIKVVLVQWLSRHINNCFPTRPLLITMSKRIKFELLTKIPHFEIYYSKIQKTQVFRILTHCIGFPMKFWSRINMKYSSIGIVKFWKVFLSHDLQSVVEEYEGNKYHGSIVKKKNGS